MIDEIDRFKKIILNNIDYDAIIYDKYYKKEDIDSIVDLMVDTVMSNNDFIYICSDKKPIALVKQRLLTLDKEHIEYVLDCLRNNSSEVRNIKAYLLTCLYNAPQTMNHYYQNRVNVEKKICN